MAVLPAWQGKGVGRAIVSRLLELVAATAPAPAFVGLFATPAAESLYGCLGFSHGAMAGLSREVQPAPVHFPC